jgi:hypothetical protein
MSNYDSNINGNVNPSPSTLARWQRGRHYTKLWGEVAYRVIMARISWRTKAVYFGLQMLLGQSELTGVLMRGGKPTPLNIAAMSLGIREKQLTEDLTVLINLGVIEQNSETGCYFDRRMAEDEIVSLWEKLRHLKANDETRGGISIAYNRLKSFIFKDGNGGDSINDVVVVEYSRV